MPVFRASTVLFDTVADAHSKTSLNGDYTYGLHGTPTTRELALRVAELEGALRAAGKDFEFHSFDGAGHGFFAVDRPSYRVEAANSGWAFIFDFFGRYLRGSAA